MTIEVDTMANSQTRVGPEEVLSFARAIEKLGLSGEVEVPAEGLLFIPALASLAANVAAARGIEGPLDRRSLREALADAIDDLDEAMAPKDD